MVGVHFHLVGDKGLHQVVVRRGLFVLRLQVPCLPTYKTHAPGHAIRDSHTRPEGYVAKRADAF